MAAVTAYGRFFDAMEGITPQTEVWLSNERLNDLSPESKVQFDGKNVIFSFGPGKEKIKVEIGNFKQELGKVSYAKLISAGGYTAPQISFVSRGRSQIYRII